MKFTLTIQCDNDAFSDDMRGEEVARILREIATKVDDGFNWFPALYDINGNNVGTAGFSE